MEDRQPLQYPAFRSIWIANLLSNLGTMIQLVGVSWSMAVLGASPQMIASVQASTSLPIVLFSVVSGAIADNSDRRKVMLWAQSYMFVVSASLAGLAFAGYTTPWLLLGFTFLVGCGTALNGPAWQASVTEMVPRQVLPGAVAYNAMGMNIARSAGPAIGGTIVAASGAATAFLLNALSSIGLIAVLARWHPATTRRVLPPERLHEAMLAGIRYVLMSPRVRVALVRALTLGFVASAIPALLPLVARDLLGGGPIIFGLLLGSFGIGAVGGALASRLLRLRFSPETIVRASTLLMAVGAAITAVSRVSWLTAFFLSFAGAGWLLIFSTMNVSVQLASPRWVTARALSLYQMAAFGGLAAGSWSFGLLADHSGLSAALLIAAGLGLVAVVIAQLLPLAEFSSENLDPLRDWDAPETAVPIQNRSGPIVLSVEHRIAATDVIRFLAVMSERRRIRLRDGARNWSLLRDLADPELWMERYRFPTWLDYVRHNNRRTQADVANSDALRALRIGHREPVVHRQIERQVGSAPLASEDGAETDSPVPYTDA